MATTSDTHRNRAVRFRVPDAQTTSATARTGKANTGRAPIAPPVIDLSSKGRIANHAAISTANAPTRSGHRARLKNRNPVEFSGR